MGDELVVRGNPLRTVYPAYASRVDFGRLDTTYPMLLIVPQNGTEKILRQRVPRPPGPGRFAGATYSLPMLLADVRIPTSEPPPITQVGTEGVVVTLPFGDGWFRAGAWLRTEQKDADFARIREAFRQIAGTDYDMSEPRWFSRFAAPLKDTVPARLTHSAATTSQTRPSPCRPSRGPAS
ncbi:hypothetical protein ACWDA3_00125 [Nonomuraea rubra]